MREIGPRITLTVKRKKFAHRDLYKRSVKYKPYWAEKSVNSHLLITFRKKILSTPVWVIEEVECISSRLIWVLFISGKTKNC